MKFLHDDLTMRAHTHKSTQAHQHQIEWTKWEDSSSNILLCFALHLLWRWTTWCIILRHKFTISLAKVKNFEQHRFNACENEHSYKSRIQMKPPSFFQDEYYHPLCTFGGRSFLFIIKLDQHKLANWIKSTNISFISITIIFIRSHFFFGVKNSLFLKFFTLFFFYSEMTEPKVFHFICIGHLKHCEWIAQKKLMYEV